MLTKLDQRNQQLTAADDYVSTAPAPTGLSAGDPDRGTQPVRMGCMEPEGLSPTALYLRLAKRKARREAVNLMYPVRHQGDRERARRLTGR